MSRLTLDDIGYPPKHLRVDLIEERFKTLHECKSEDLGRASSLRRESNKDAPVFDIEAGHHLAKHLQDGACGGSEHPFVSSSVYMGRKQICFIGALWGVLYIPDTRLFTLMPPGLTLPIDQLEALDPRQILKRLDGTLTRCGARSGEGVLAAAIHGEYDPTTCLFQLHLHGVADREMVDAVNRLKTTPTYRTRRSGGEYVPRVLVRKRPPTNLPVPLTYILQRYWPARWRGEVNGKVVRSSVRGRIPEPDHSRLLLWLDQWRVQDLVLIKGMRVTKAGLCRATGE